MTNLIVSTALVPAADDGPPAHPADILDPAGLGPMPTLPLLPEALRRAHAVHVPADGRFKQAARMLQALYREDRGIPIGRYRDGNGKLRRLGSMISTQAGDQGANIIDPDDLPVVTRELIYREIGAVYDIDRLKRNLLSSQPLVFNTCSCLKRDLALATRVFAELLPGLIAEVTHVLFEHAPGRDGPRSVHASAGSRPASATRDHTAYDLAVRGRSSTGARVLVGLEFKYSESCLEPVPRFTGNYDALAPRTELFIDAADRKLRANPVQQFFRQTCLAAAALELGLADTAMVVVVAPQHNLSVHSATDAFAGHLRDPERGRVPFRVITLERLFAALVAAGRPEHARRLYRRYCDFWLIDGELELAAVPTVPAAATTDPDTPPSAPGSRRMKARSGERSRSGPRSRVRTAA